MKSIIVNLTASTSVGHLQLGVAALSPARYADAHGVSDCHTQPDSDWAAGSGTEG